MIGLLVLTALAAAGAMHSHLGSRVRRAERNIEALWRVAKSNEPPTLNQQPRTDRFRFDEIVEPRPGASADGGKA